MEKQMKTFWTREYQRNIGKMIGVCYRYVPDRATAEDLAHSAFLQAIEKADTFKGIGRFDKWLMRITVNTALMHLRKTQNEQHLGKNDEVEDYADPFEKEEDTSAEEMMDTIRKADFTTEEILRAISKLPENHRIVLNMYVFDHYTHQQIATALGISVNTSKSHLMRARKELQKILFQESKSKKHPLMMIFPLFAAPETAIDVFCRRKLDGFSLAPLHPLPESSYPASAYNQLSLRMQLHAYRLPIAAGLTTAGVAGAVILANSLPHATPVSPKQPDKQPIPVVKERTDTVNHVLTDTTASIPVATPLEQTRKGSATKRSTSSSHNNSNSQSTESSAPSSDTHASTAESEHPPVIVKKIRRTNRTIVIQDSLNK